MSIKTVKELADHGSMEETVPLSATQPSIGYESDRVKIGTLPRTLYNPGSTIAIFSTSNTRVCNTECAPEFIEEDETC